MNQTGPNNPLIELGWSPYIKFLAPALCPTIDHCVSIIGYPIDLGTKTGEGCLEVSWIEKKP
jgi:hypothetical protein